MQVVARDGEAAYTSMGDCFIKVFRQEGIGAFFKGSGMRVMRSSPQFGITLMSYEMLAKVVYGDDVDMKKLSPPTNAPIQPDDYRTAFGTNQRNLYNKMAFTDGMLGQLGGEGR